MAEEDPVSVERGWKGKQLEIANGQGVTNHEEVCNVTDFVFLTITLAHEWN